MNFQELATSVAEGPLTLFASATTGLKPSEDKLLAASVIQLEQNGVDIKEARTIVRRIDDDELLLKSSEIHGISRERNMEEGLTDEEFSTELKSLLGSAGPVLTYNPDFLEAFIEPVLPSFQKLRLYSLPLIVKGAEMRQALREDKVKTLTDLESLYPGKAPGFKKLTEQYGISSSDPLLLPVEANCRALYALWSRLYDIPALVLPSAQQLQEPQA